mmetsp:Transcript_30342/g.73813  ORF Transcript_30342/g.73813 Transcript_30342/m.73813 type:complete len:293 (+) Transcript_30342:113-991(+)
MTNAKTKGRKHDGAAQKTIEEVESFYKDHHEIKESHGIGHVMRVYNHAKEAVQVHNTNNSVPNQPDGRGAVPMTDEQSMMVLIAALLHDVDDHKYFPNNNNYENARTIMDKVFDTYNNGDSSHDTKETIIQLISFVSCSKNKNSIPELVKKKEKNHHQLQGSEDDAYWMLIPRWADRLEAVGRQGVVRCYQYNREHGEKLSSEKSPRPQTEEEVWFFAKPQRFENYDGNSTDMISHYYDKLLHVSCPPPDIVRNPYLERMAKESSKELVEVCVRYGRTGVVDEEYIQSLQQQ